MFSSLTVPIEWVGCDGLAEFGADRFPHLRIIAILDDKEVRLPRRVHLLRKPYCPSDGVSLAAA